MSYATNHARSRIKERVTSSKRQNTLIDKAKKLGVERRSIKGRFRKYLDSLWHKHDKTHKYVVYSQKVFVFDKFLDNLVTVLPLPGNLASLAAKLVKKKEGGN